MTILSPAEFQIKSKKGVNSLERIYKGKSLKGGPVFSSDNLEAANAYCRRFRQKENGAICIIVKDESFLRIWSEVVQTEADTSQDTNSKDTEISINSLPVQSEFINFCQKLLADEIGPIASTICKKTLAKNPNLTRIEFVTILAKKISDPALARKFKQAALE